uniref:Uncharacterized protein n=1 Tax=Trichuris muris TaxID=70415 RepID=A0A5S6PZG2_TRIMR
MLLLLTYVLGMLLAQGPGMVADVADDGALAFGCPEDACQNGGSCVLTENGHVECKCIPGYTGTNCEEADSPCQKNPCYNSGICTFTTFDDGGIEVTCICPEGYNGTLCEFDVENICEREGRCVNGYCVPQTSDSYYCNCYQGYTGMDCDTVNLCAYDVCKNGATCSATLENYECFCNPGFHGQNCTDDIDECLNNATICGEGTCYNTFGSFYCHCPDGATGNKCNTSTGLNQASCEITKDGIRSCKCPPGLTGSRCELLTSSCDDMVCHSGGSCEITGNRSRCNCAPGYTGPTCEFDVNECTEHPGICQNGGVCLNMDGDYLCQCKNSWYGKNCDRDVNECGATMCLNGGTCQYVSGKYICICPKGYIGDMCQLLDQCYENPCAEHSTCASSVLDGSYECLCPPGWTGPLCDADIDECLLQPCWHNSTCVNVIGSYECLCAEGTFRTNCHKNTDSCWSNPCLHDGTCHGLLNAYKCECKPEYSGENCEILRNCTNSTCSNDGSPAEATNGYSEGIYVHESSYCLSNICFNGGTCSVLSGTYHCRCPPGSYGTRCQFKLFTTCNGSSCQNGGVCVNVRDGFKCLCLEGYTGIRCEINNYCKQLEPCLNGATCLSDQQGYLCHCPSGFIGRRCERRVDDCGAVQCWNGGSCEKFLHGEICHCLPGFNGKFCESEIDECASQPCLNNGTCRDYVNSYTCTCKMGFSGSNCEINDEDCSPTTCLNGGRCIDGVNNYSCLCEPGYSGRNCQHPPDQCQCKNGATCISIESFSYCKCAHGFTGVFCEDTVNLCAEEPCKNGGTCVQQKGNFLCNCPDKWTGATCDAEMISCGKAAQRRNVTRQALCNGGRCVNRERSHMCFCPLGLEGTYCERRIEYCNSNPCQHGLCTSQNVGYTCECFRGYGGPNCEFNVDDCQPNPCQNAGTCHDMIDGYECSCPYGTTGKNCQVNYNDCYPGACHHEGTCVDKVGGFDCICPPGFVGRRCEGDINECSSSPCSIEGAVRCLQKDSNFSCVCRTGYTGHRCDLSYDFCSANVCKHGAHCIALLNACVCQPGYRGEFCEEMIPEECTSSPCLNGGSCVSGQSPSEPYVCDCLAGTSGRHCEVRYVDNCLVDGCLNGGSCESQNGTFVCQCPPLFSGAQCHLPALSFAEDDSFQEDSNTTGSSSNALDERFKNYICYINMCHIKANDKSCNLECNSYVCGFDGVDCVDNPESFHQCTDQVYCANVFMNDICDPKCDNEDCLFDGFDCAKMESDCFDDFDHYCAGHAGDGSCNLECNSSGCNFDGGDCMTEVQRASGQMADGIAMVLAANVSKFEKEIGRFLMVIGNLVHAVVRVDKDDHGQRMIYQWSSQLPYLKDEIRIPRSRRRSELNAESPGEFQSQPLFQSTLVVLTVHVIPFYGADTFTDVSKIVDFLSAGPTMRKIREYLGYELHSARVHDKRNSARKVLLTMIASTMIATTMLCLAAVILVCRRAMAPIRNPPGSDGSLPGEGSYHDQDSPRSCAAAKPATEAAETLIPLALIRQGEIAERRNFNTGVEEGSSKLLLAWLKENFSKDIHSSNSSIMGECKDEFQRITSTLSNEDLDNLLVKTASHSFDDHKEQCAIMDALISAGANVNCHSGQYKDTPVIAAVKHAHLAATRHLLQRGANPNCKDVIGRTALHHAVARLNKDLVNLLVNSGQCNLEEEDVNGCTAVLLAAQHSKVDCSIFSSLMKANADLCAVDDDGMTCTHWAAHNNNVGILMLLLSRNAIWRGQDLLGRNALFVAMTENSTEAVRFLYQCGFGQQMMDCSYQFPFHAAKEWGSIDHADLLNGMPAEDQSSLQTSQSDASGKDLDELFASSPSETESIPAATGRITNFASMASDSDKRASILQGQRRCEYFLENFFGRFDAELVTLEDAKDPYREQNNGERPSSSIVQGVEKDTITSVVAPGSSCGVLNSNIPDRVDTSTSNDGCPSTSGQVGLGERPHAAFQALLEDIAPENDGATLLDDLIKSMKEHYSSEHSTDVYTWSESKPAVDDYGLFGNEQHARGNVESRSFASNFSVKRDAIHCLNNGQRLLTVSEVNGGMMGADVPGDFSFSHEPPSTSSANVNAPQEQEHFGQLEIVEETSPSRKEHNAT